jgi:hypothetical protein
MLDSPIKFPSNPSSNEDELPFHHSSEENVSSDDRMSDYSPPWSSEDPKEDEDEEDADDFADDFDNSNSDSDFASPPPKWARWAWSSLWEDHI